jgi:hypothetical protein
VREDELAAVPFIEIELAMGFRPVSIERTVPRGATHAFRKRECDAGAVPEHSSASPYLPGLLETVDGLIRAGR